MRDQRREDKEISKRLETNFYFAKDTFLIFFITRQFSFQVTSEAILNSQIFR